MIHNHDNIVIMSSQNKKRVFVGLSGGVDSAVSAGLLIKAGYDVTGVFIKVWQPDWIECNWKEERRDAMRVSAHLGIPFITLDLVKEYKQDVIDYMIREYENGRTPNPDVMCNRYVKFGGFLKWAREQGADFVATGHYARVENGVESKFDLLAGIDKNKDQSYFLWTLNQKDLANILFPVGHLTKPEVRKLAEEFDLPNATKKDSQGLCFIGKVDVKEFLKHYIKTEKGNVINEKGQIIGHHPGALLFTIGERHGFVVTNKSPNDLPYFVVNKNTKDNTITVSNRQGLKSDTDSRIVNISDINWVKGVAPSVGSIFQARTRYRQPLQDIRLIKTDNNSATVEFKYDQETITSGQSLVMYDGKVCLGGGVIC